MDEVTVAGTWLRQRLLDLPEVQALGSGGVWRDVAEQGTDFPYIVYSLQSSSDETTAGDLVGTFLTFQIKVISIQGESEDLTSAALAAIRESLRSANDTSQGYSIAVRGVPGSGVFSYPEYDRDQGRYYSHDGRMWRFYLSDN